MHRLNEMLAGGPNIKNGGLRHQKDDFIINLESHFIQPKYPMGKHPPHNGGIMNRLKNISTIGELSIVVIFVCSLLAPLYSIAFPTTDAHLKNHQNAEPSNNKNNSGRIKAEELRRLFKSL